MSLHAEECGATAASASSPVAQGWEPEQGRSIPTPDMGSEESTRLRLRVFIEQILANADPVRRKLRIRIIPVGMEPGEELIHRESGNHHVDADHRRLIFAYPDDVLGPYLVRVRRGQG